MPSRIRRHRTPARTNPVDVQPPAAGPSQGIPADPPVPGVSTALPAAEVQLFLDFARVEKGLAANSVASYRRDLTEFSAFLRRQGKSFPAVGRDDIRNGPPAFGPGDQRRTGSNRNGASAGRAGEWRTASGLQASAILARGQRRLN